MLPVESTPLRKGSVELWGAVACLDVDGAHKNVVLFGETKVLQSSPGEHPTSARRLPVFNDIFIVLIYVLYIYIQLYFIFSMVPYTTARRGQRTVGVALVRYGRERRAVGGSARRSAQMPTLHGKRAHRSAPP